MRGEFENILVSKEKLLAAVHENLTKHQDQYKGAVAGYLAGEKELARKAAAGRPAMCAT